ncbi:MAG: hypothetical protein QHH14_00850 [Clostridiales bacterium]|nr:hypothetical protein [Clostridiales bacterium]
MDRRILKLLYRSLDSPLKKKDEEWLKKALEESEELRQQKIELLSLRQSVAESAGRSFPPGFAERVRRRMHGSQKAKNNLDPQFRAYRAVFKPFAIATLAILIILVAYTVSQDELLPKDKIFYVSDLTAKKLLQVPVF